MLIRLVLFDRMKSPLIRWYYEHIPLITSALTIWCRILSRHHTFTVADRHSDCCVVLVLVSMGINGMNFWPNCNISPTFPLMRMWDAEIPRQLQCPEQLKLFFTNLDFPEIRVVPFLSYHWGPRSCEVAIIWPDECIKRLWQWKTFTSTSNKQKLSKAVKSHVS